MQSSNIFSGSPEELPVGHQESDKFTVENHDYIIEVPQPTESSTSGAFDALNFLEGDPAYATLVAYGNGISFSPRKVTKAVYLLVKSDGTTYKFCPELAHQSDVVGVCQFIATIQMFTIGATSWAVPSVTPVWSEIASSFGVLHLFIQDSGNHGDDAFCISLFDPKE